MRAANSVVAGVVLLRLLDGPSLKASAAPLTPANRQTPASPCDPAKLRVIVDVGHTREAGGALSARGVHEYEFNLRLATLIRSDLAAAGFPASELLISKGARRTLEQRADRANAAHADLFISIHHDSVQDSYLRPWTYQGHRYLYSDRFRGYSIFVSYENAYLDASRRFANDIADELLAHGMRFTTHHAERIKGESRDLIEPERGVYRYDQLVVLKRTNAPAVLLEAGVIVNRAEELLAGTPAFRKKVSESVVAATARFCQRGGQAGP